MVAGILADLKGAVSLPCYTVGDKSQISELVLNKVKQIANYLGGKKYLVGDNVTYIDFILFELCDFMSWLTDGAIYTQHLNLEAYFHRVKELPKLKEFFEDDEKCIKRPFNNKEAKLNN